MRVERGASQILFGLLPGQTADLEGRIWKVTQWLDPVPIPLDQDAVRAALLGAIAPWAATGNDDGRTSAVPKQVQRPRIGESQRPQTSAARRILIM